MTQKSSSHPDYSQAKRYFLVGTCVFFMEILSVIKTRHFSIDSLAMCCMALMFVGLGWTIFSKEKTPVITIYINFVSRSLGIIAISLWAWFLYIKFSHA
jgi:hypothetical protein